MASGLPAGAGRTLANMTRRCEASSLGGCGGPATGRALPADVLDRRYGSALVQLVLFKSTADCQ